MEDDDCDCSPARADWTKGAAALALASVLLFARRAAALPRPRRRCHLHLRLGSRRRSKHTRRAHAPGGKDSPPAAVPLRRQPLRRLLPLCSSWDVLEPTEWGVVQNGFTGCAGSSVATLISQRMHSAAPRVSSDLLCSAAGAPPEAHGSQSVTL